MHHNSRATRLSTITLLLATACSTPSDDTRDDEARDSIVFTTTNLALVEAETMTLPLDAVIENDTTASAGKAVAMYRGGSLTKAFSLTQAANGISVIARGDACSGDPHMVVKVDGVALVSSDVASTSAWSTYVGTGAIASGSHTLEISFDNDFYGGTGCDRNLRVDTARITFDDTTSLGVTATLEADARVEAASPSGNFGTATTLAADTSPQIHGFLRFKVSGVSGVVQSAKLRMAVTNGTTNGPALRATSNAWSETAITWSNQPAAGALAENKGSIAQGAPVEYDVTSLVTGNGTFSFALIPDSSDGFAASSREGATPPVLVITTSVTASCGDGTCAATETCSSCSMDCGACPLSCGDALCNNGETCSTCASDCGACPATCGDGACNNGETCSSCTGDCGTCPLPGTGDIVVAAVGDMNPESNTSTSSPSGKNAAAIIAANVDLFVGIGDFQYTAGTCSSLVASWDRLWGALMPKLFHIAGPTHDSASSTDELGYRAHFGGTCANQTTGKSGAVALLGRTIGPHEYYSFDRGNWHFTMMPTTLYRYDTSKVAAATAFMDQDLAAAKAAGKFLVVVWHDPYWTSTTSAHGPLTAAKPWIDLCDKYDVRILLSGSQHNVEIFHPQLANSTRNDATGTQQFQVSTGGIGLRSFTNTPANLLARDSATHGWLRLVLHADGSYDWKFNPVSGAFSHTGSRAKP
ncbi:MAG: DNRLRE domain-containing protein [Deltaproteobacteria bacterium]|nr:DNRLRE domain-containing protein [Deltaproteobacteria bacterium]